MSRSEKIGAEIDGLGASGEYAHDELVKKVRSAADNLRQGISDDQNGQLVSVPAGLLSTLAVDACVLHLLSNSYNALMISQGIMCLANNSENGGKTPDVIDRDTIAGYMEGNADEIVNMLADCAIVARVSRAILGVGDVRCAAAMVQDFILAGPNEDDEEASGQETPAEQPQEAVTV